MSNHIKSNTSGKPNNRAARATGVSLSRNDETRPVEGTTSNPSLPTTKTNPTGKTHQGYGQVSAAAVSKSVDAAIDYHAVKRKEPGHHSMSAAAALPQSTSRRQQQSPVKTTKCPSQRATKNSPVKAASLPVGAVGGGDEGFTYPSMPEHTLSTDGSGNGSGVTSARAAELLHKLRAHYNKGRTNATVCLTDEQIRSHMKQLGDCLQLEDLDSCEVCDKKKDLDFLTQEYFATAQVARKTDLARRLVSKLKELLDIIQPLDIGLLLKLIEDARVANAQLKGRDVILFLGKSGAGKTTTTLTLSGFKMMKNDKGRIDVHPDNPIRNHMRIGGGGQSVTRIVRALQYGNTNVVLCDTPGTGDTAGVEVDIANGIGIIHAIRGSKSVRPVIVMSQIGMGDRMEGLVNDHNTLKEMFADFRGMLKHFNYIFTKYEKAQEEDLSDTMNETLGFLQDNLGCDQSYADYLRDIIHKTAIDNTATPKRRPIILCPIDDGLQSLSKIMQSLLAAPPITNPANEFQNFVSANSMGKLVDQISLVRKVLSLALRRNHVEALGPLFYQLETLASLQLNHCENALAECCKEVNNYVKANLDSVTTRLASCLHDGNASVENEILAIICIVKSMLLLAPTAKKHLKHYADLDDLCSTQIRDTIDKLVAESTSGSGSSSSSSVSTLHWHLSADSPVVTRLLKLRHFANMTTELLTGVGGGRRIASFAVDSYKTRLHALILEIERAVVAADESISSPSDKFLKLVEHLRCIDAGIILFSVHVPNINLRAVKAALLDKLWSYLGREVAEAARQLEPSVMEILPEGMASLKAACQLLEDVKAIQGLDLHTTNSKDRLASLEKDLLMKLDHFGGRIKRAVTGLRHDMSPDCAHFTATVSLMHNANSLLQISVLSASARLLMNELVHHVKGIVQLLEREFKRWLRVLCLIETGDVAAAMASIEHSLIFMFAVDDKLKNYKGVTDGEYLRSVEFLIKILNDILESQQATRKPIELGDFDVIRGIVRWVHVAINIKRCTGDSDRFKPVADRTNQIMSQSLPLFQQLMMDTQVKFASLFALPDILNVEDLEPGMVCVNYWRLASKELTALQCELTALQCDPIDTQVAEIGNLCSTMLSGVQSSIQSTFDSLQGIIDQFHGVIEQDLQAAAATPPPAKLIDAANTIGRNMRFLRELNIFLEIFSTRPVPHTQKLPTDLIFSSPMKVFKQWSDEFGSKLHSFARHYAVKRGSAEVPIFDVVGSYEAIKVCEALSSFDTLLLCPKEIKYGAVVKEHVELVHNHCAENLSELQLALNRNDFGCVRRCFEKQKPMLLNAPELERQIGNARAGLATLLSDKVAAVRAAAQSLQADSRRLDDKVERLFGAVDTVEGMILHVGEFIEHDIVEAAQVELKGLLVGIADVITSASGIFGRVSYFLDCEDLPKCTRALEVCKTFVHACQQHPAALDVVDGRAAYIKPFVQRLSELNQMLEDFVAKRVSLYKLLPLEDYHANSPLVLWEQLGQCACAVNQHHLPNLLENIKAQVTIVLLKAKDSGNQTDCEEAVGIVSRIRSVLPAAIVDSFTKLLEDVEAYIREAKEEDSKQERNARGSNDKELLQNLLTMYLDLTMDPSRMKDYAEKIHACIVRQFQAYMNYIKKGDTLTVLSNLPSALETWNNCICKMEEVPIPPPKWSLYGSKVKNSVPLFDLDKMVRVLMTSLSDRLYAVFEDGETIRSSEQEDSVTLNRIQGYFAILKQMVESEQEDPEFYVCLDSYIGTRSKSLKDGLQLICNILVDFSKKAATAMENGDIAKITTLMHTAQRFEKFFRELKEFAEKPSIKCNFEKFSKAALSAEVSTFQQLVDALTLKMLEWKNLVRANFLDHSRTQVEATRDTFYKQLYRALVCLKQAETLTDYINSGAIDVHEEIKDQEKKIAAQMKPFCVEIQRLVNEEFPTGNGQSLARMSMCYDNLTCFADQFTDSKVSEAFTDNTLVPVVNTMIADLDAKFHEKLTDEAKIMKELPVTNLNQIKDSLIRFKNMGFQLKCVTATVDQLLDSILDHFVSANANSIGQLSVMLSNEATAEKGVAGSQNRQGNPIAAMLLDQHKVFEEFKDQARYEIMLRIGIDDLLGLKKNSDGTVHYLEENFYLRGNNVVKPRIKTLVEEFYEMFWMLVEEGSDKVNSAKQQYLGTLVERARRIAIEYTQLEKQRYIQLCPYIFAYCSLFKWYNKSSRSSSVGNTVAGAADDAENVNIIRKAKWQPHCAQVIAIFRLLGVDGDHGLKNHLAQIKTGEGKSIVLAGVATVLALMGNAVDCGCYSESLSMRDKEDFAGLFVAFRVDSYIKYGTFNKLCEDLINRRGKIRELVQNEICASATAGSTCSVAVSPPPTHATTARPRILLIDEVDVFLNEDFYGNYYHPFAKLDHQSIGKLLKYVWANRTNAFKLRFINISLTAEYQAVCAAYPGWEDLVMHLTKNMCREVNNFNLKEYSLDGNRRIGYKDQDTVSFKIFHGFQTIFAYFFEYENMRITEAAFQEQLMVPIDCGTFSFAEIPKLYKHIMGVSGTLETLSAAENNVLSGVYGINKRTFIPSVYGRNLDFEENSKEYVIIDSAPAHHINIANEIKKRLKGGPGPDDYPRAVLVFFESISALNEFYQSRACDSFKSTNTTVNVLTEETNASRKEDLINKATTSNMVTLLTGAFARGTDFICYDERLQSLGGVHVTLTYFAPMQSAEEQGKGRTGRQGNKGSFSLVLSAKDLEKFGMDADFLKGMGGVDYKAMDLKRKLYFEEQYAKSMKKVAPIKDGHAHAIKFIDQIIAGNRKKEVHDFIIERNACIEDATPVRTIVLMDGTGSMTDVLQRAKATVKEMMRRTYAILKDEGKESSFLVQFAVYRQYNALPSAILQKSNWADHPTELYGFMDNVKAEYGDGDEAVEIGLAHANREHSEHAITQVILIGDRPPHQTREVVKEQRLKFKFSLNEGVYAETFWEDEVNKLQQAGVKIHAFNVGPLAAEIFGVMSQKTNGESAFLDVTSKLGKKLTPDEEANLLSHDEGASLLTKTVAKVLLDAAVGFGAEGARMKRVYDEKYPDRGYVA